VDRKQGGIRTSYMPGSSLSGASMKSVYQEISQAAIGGQVALRGREPGRASLKSEDPLIDAEGSAANGKLFTVSIDPCLAHSDSQLNDMSNSFQSGNKYRVAALDESRDCFDVVIGDRARSHWARLIVQAIGVARPRTSPAVWRRSYGHRPALAERYALSVPSSPCTPRSRSHGSWSFLSPCRSRPSGYSLPGPGTPQRSASTWPAACTGRAQVCRPTTPSASMPPDSCAPFTAVVVSGP